MGWLFPAGGWGVQTCDGNLVGFPEEGEIAYPNFVAVGGLVDDWHHELVECSLKCWPATVWDLPSLRAPEVEDNPWNQVGEQMDYTF